MADYPSMPQIIGSRVVPNDGTVVERATSGKPRIRRFFTKARNVIAVLHELDGPDKDTIIAHYDANKDMSFLLNFVADGVAYTVRYANKPAATPLAGFDHWRVQTSLIDVG